ncbi:hypothetical protein Bbelb_154490 [Branchiostoma belcheri]|nr:hypothetical protein Bbelb_154490 [Branchiostoma belcheri]
MVAELELTIHATIRTSWYKGISWLGQAVFGSNSFPPPSTANQFPVVKNLPGKLTESGGEEIWQPRRKPGPTTIDWIPVCLHDKSAETAYFLSSSTAQNTSQWEIPDDTHSKNIAESGEGGVLCVPILLTLTEALLSSRSTRHTVTPVTCTSTVFVGDPETWQFPIESSAVQLGTLTSNNRTLHTPPSHARTTRSDPHA